MKKRLIMIMTVLVLVCGVVLASASVNWYESGEWRDADTSDDIMPKFSFSSVDTGYEIYGVCSSADKQDWYGIRATTNGIFNVQLNLSNTNLDADIYIVRPDGTVLYPGYTSGNSKFLTNLYIPQDEWWMLKIVYKSGIPQKPYELKVQLNQASLRAYSQVKNIEDVPKELLNE